MLDYSKSFINSQNRGAWGVFNLWIAVGCVIAVMGFCLCVYGVSCAMIDESLN